MLEFRPSEAPPTEIVPDLTVVDIENAVGTRLMLAELGLGHPLVVNERYRVLRILGRGACGLVCVASDVHLHREVALKLYPAYGPGPVSADVAREAQALARLKHPNIVAVYDFGHASLNFESGELTSSKGTGLTLVPCFFMSMEFVRGQSLRRWLATGVPLRDRVLDMFVHAAEGLAHAHEAGLAHRDFKPDNVMVDDSGRVMVVDFGLASRRQSVAEISRSTALARWQPPRVVGTPEYMAPEAHLGRATAASDQYSFAVALHEALLGHLPPTSPSGLAFVEHHRFPAAVARVLTRAMSPDPRYRYASMRELLTELPRRWDDQWRWTTLDDEAPAKRAPPWALIVAAAALVIAGAGFWAGKRYDADEGRELADAASEPRAPHAEANEARSEPADDEPSTERPKAPATIPGFGPPRASCDELLGRWRLESYDLWGFDFARQGERGYNELSIERVGAEPCDLVGTLTRTGSSLHTYEGAFVGRAPLRVEHDHGLLWVGGLWTLSKPGKARDLRLRFELALVGEGLRGNYERYLTSPDGIERPSMAGVANATRDGRPFTRIETLAEVPCPSQCALLCAGPNATATCQRRCTPGFAIHECGAPGPEFVDPYTTQRNLDKLATGEWSPATQGRACTELLDQLADHWTVHERLDEGGVHSWMVNLRRSGECMLVGEALDFPTRHTLRGWVDDKGGWIIQATDAPRALLWSMQGWTFALGSSSGDRPGRLSAYKRR